MEKKISVKDLLMQAFLTGWELSDKSIAQTNICRAPFRSSKCCRWSRKTSTQKRASA